jgi:AmmeMemoRadiSam system protein A
MSLRSEPSRAVREPQEYSAEERRLLLQAAHDSVTAAAERRAIPVDSPSAHLSKPRGVFTTLYLDGTLRGCVGFPLAIAPLYEAVIETARGAALEDPRFPPVTPQEANRITVSLSVMSPLMEIPAEKVEVGKHGLLICEGPRRGLLLPQVAVEHGWDRETFLQHTCRKAGLPADAWRQGARIEVFTAEVFGEEDPETP